MSEKAESKKISRPKLGFSQPVKQNEEEAVQQCEEKDTQQSEAEKIDAPKIKNIVTFHVPVKILNLEETASARGKEESLSRCKADGSTHTDNIASENVQGSTSQAVKDESKEVDAKNDAKKNAKKERNMLQFDKKLDNIVQNYTNLRQRREKLRSAPKTRNQSTKTERPNSKGGLTLSPSSMPYHKIAAENKVFPIRKNLCPVSNEFDTKQEFSHLIVPWEKSILNTEWPSASELRKNVCFKEHTIGQRWLESKCNSVVCVSDKLRKIKQQRIPVDMNHLSTLQKSIINGKISAALDFKLDEAIYKNLVDLTVTEETLPSAVTRTKDPEPREKDITPKLSTFFVPTQIDEYYEVAHVKLRPPKINENWNAFKISRKIGDWRYNLNDFDEIM